MVRKGDSDGVEASKICVGELFLYLHLNGFWRQVGRSLKMVGVENQRGKDSDRLTCGNGFSIIAGLECS